MPSDKEKRDREKFDQFIKWLLNNCIEKQYDPAHYLRHTLYTWNPLPEEFSMNEINMHGRIWWMTKTCGQPENHTDQRLVLQQPHWKPLSSANDQTAQAQGVHQTSNVNTFCMTHSWTVLNSKEDFAHFRCESSGNLIEILYRPRSAADIVQRQDFLHSAQLAISIIHVPVQI